MNNKKNINFPESEPEDLREYSFSRTKVEAWPGFQFPTLEVEVLAVKLIKEDFLTFNFQDFPGNMGKAFIKPPEELYLREIFDLDIQSTEDVLKFTKIYGRLGEDNWESLPSQFGEVEHYNEFQQDINRFKREFMMEPDDYSQEGHPIYLFDELAHITEITAHVSLLRDLVRIWDFYKGGISFSSLRESWENPIISLPEDKQAALSILETVLNQGLSKIDIRIQVSPMYDPENKSRFRGNAPTLFNVLCLQFVNHIAQDASYYRCENSACKRRFVHQRGRAKYGQHRSEGVKYCSKKCATAKAVRDHRVREKARKLSYSGKSPKEIAHILNVKVESVNDWINE